MESKHTTGRIRLKNTRIYSNNGGIDCMATMQVSNQPQWDEDARRLVACWNACDGIGTEALESAGHACNGWKLASYAMNEAKSQRDQLLAASINARDMLATERQAFVDCNAIHKLTTNLDQERIVVYGDGIWLDKDDAEVVHDYDHALAQLDAAIAKATGQ